MANGIHTHTTSEFDYYIIGGCPGVLCVAADSPYTTYDEFIEAAKENPGELKVSNSGRGKLWHLKTYIAAGSARSRWNTFLTAEAATPSLPA